MARLEIIPRTRIQWLKAHIFAPFDSWPAKERWRDEKLCLIIRENPGPRQTKFTLTDGHSVQNAGISGCFSKITRLEVLYTT